ncbi:MAG: diguanylate cyclase [Frankiales bacterium]|nr:diguanylate cyclase [Frankiales bacterium]
MLRPSANRSTRQAMPDAEIDDAEPGRAVLHAHTGLVSAAQFRASLDELTARNVRPVTAALSVLFTTHAVVYSLRTPLNGHADLATYSATAAVAYAFMWVLSGLSPVVPGRANVIGLVIGVIAGGNCVAGVFFGHVQQSALLTILAVIAISLFARATGLFVSLVALVAGSWFAAAAYELPLRQWQDQILPIGSAIGVSVVAHLIFLRTERRLEETKAELSLAAAVDDLTGLYNKRGFLMVGEQLLRQAIQGRVPVTLLFIDVDEMKLVNDSRGHAAGDDLLRDLGAVLRATFREADVLGRFGGDEFCVLMVGSQQRLAAERLRDAVEVHNTMTPARRLMISVGEVQYLGTVGETLQTLIARGDAEMYAEKARRRTA